MNLKILWIELFKNFNISRANNVKGKSNGDLSSLVYWNAMLFLHLINSKVEEDNENRYDAIKSMIEAESETAERQLTPPEIPSAHTPITLNPMKGKFS